MGKQAVIKGTEAESIKEIDEAIEAYVEVRDERMRLTGKEVDLRTILEERMRKHKKKIYRHSDGMFVVTFETKEKAKVKKEKTEED